MRRPDRPSRPRAPAESARPRALAEATGAERASLASALELRGATRADAPAMRAVALEADAATAPTLGALLARIAAFPAGQIVALRAGRVVGFASACVLPEPLAFSDLSFDALTGAGLLTRHDADGDWLYALAPVAAGDGRARTAARLERAQRALAEALGLAGVARAVPVGRGAGSAPSGRAPVWLRDYAPGREVSGYLGPSRSARLYALPLGRPSAAPALGRARPTPEIARVVSVQMEARRIAHPDAFFERLASFVEIAGREGYGADFVCFPEHFTLALLSCEAERVAPERAIEHLSRHTERLTRTLTDLATRHGVNVIGGSHATRVADGTVQNVAFVALRDGTLHARYKLHPTPDERKVWAIAGGGCGAGGPDAIETDRGPIGVMICYDSEFPAHAERLTDQGARLLFVPYCTDARTGHLRVRYCCQARAVETQAYVITSGNCGVMTNVANMDANYAESAILTPSDHAFARDGVAAAASPNVEGVVVADLDLALVAHARCRGQVRNFRDRRSDLYLTRWVDGG